MLRANGHDTRGGASLPLVKVNTKQAVKVCVQSERPVWADVHWFGRQIPCAGEGCPACALQPHRTRGYFIATVETGARWRPALVEVAPSSFSQLAGLQAMADEAFGPGVLIEITRRRMNSPLRLEPLEGTHVVVPDLTPPSVAMRALAVLWRLPMPLEAELEEDYEARVRDAVLSRLRTAMDGAD